MSSDNVQSVARAFALLEALNRRAASSIDQLYRDTGLPKPTIVRLLKTLIARGYVTNDARQRGYRVTARVDSLSSGYHGDPLVVEAARPWAISLTHSFKWPVGVAILDRDAVVIRFSTIPDSPISPFHTSLNLRLSLFSRALGLAYYAFCPEAERQLLLAMAGPSEADLLSSRDARWLQRRVELAQQKGYAERDIGVEPKNSGTVAVPIMSGQGVAATIGITFFRIAVTREDVERYAAALHDTAAAIEKQIKLLSIPA